MIISDAGSYLVSNRTAPEIVEMPYPKLGVFASLFPASGVSGSAVKSQLP